MTKKQQLMRESSRSYAVIAVAPGVEPYCRRHQSGGNWLLCEQYHKPVLQTPRRKHKCFCSNASRMKCWAGRYDQLQARGESI